MIFDIHTHTFPDQIASRAVAALSRASHTRAFSDGTNDGLIRRMKEAGISGSLILPVATSARQVESINTYAAETNRIHGTDGLVSFGCMHPMYDNWHDELQRIRDLGLKGIKIHPVYQETDIDDPRFIRIIRRAAEVGLIVLTHAGLDIGFPGEVRCSPRQCRRVVEEVGAFPFVLAHMGGWRNWEEAADLLADTGVFIDTSFSSGRFYPLPGDTYWKEEDCSLLGREDFTRLIRRFGADHVLFGSDSPWSDQRESVDFIRSLPLSRTDQEKILGQNAVKLLGLETI